MADISPHSPLIGRILGERIEILELIGSGGMGDIYRARQTDLDVLRAVKVLRASMVDSREAAARLRREALTLNRLQHESIVSVLELGKIDDWAGVEDALYLVMEYIAGPDLHAKVLRNGPLSLSNGLEILSQIADALDYAHSKGIVHRDLKPSNVLLQEDNPGWVKIIDFGLAKIISKEMVTKLTAESQVLGTPLFMAPEQCMAKQAGPPCDIYALAGVAYYVFSGQPVFSGLSPMATILAHCERQPPLLSERCTGSEIPAALDALLAACLAKDPTHRPTAKSFLGELTAIKRQVAHNVPLSISSSATAAPQQSPPVDGPASAVREGTVKDTSLSTAQLIWHESKDLVSTSHTETLEDAAIAEALVNQITTLTTQIAHHLIEELDGLDWVAAELEKIAQTERAITDMEIDRALIESQLSENDGHKAPLAESSAHAAILYRRRQLDEHATFMRQGLTQSFMALFQSNAACRGQVVNPHTIADYETMDELINQYLQILRRFIART